MKESPLPRIRFTNSIKRMKMLFNRLYSHDSFIISYLQCNSVELLIKFSIFSVDLKMYILICILIPLSTMSTYSSLIIQILHHILPHWSSMDWLNHCHLLFASAFIRKSVKIVSQNFLSLFRFMFAITTAAAIKMFANTTVLLGVSTSAHNQFI